MSIPVTTRSGKGSPLTSGEMDTNLTNLARSATEAQEGNIEIASQAETTAMADLLKAVPPGYLAGAMDAYISSRATPRKLAATNGYIYLEGGILLQWGSNNSTTGASQAFSFNIDYDSTAYGVGVFRTSGSPLYGMGAETKSATGFTIDRNAELTGTVPFFWIAIGPGVYVA